MQKSKLSLEEVYQSSFKNFVVKFKIALKVLTAKKTFIVIDHDINVFGMNTHEVAKDCSIIYYNLSNHHQEPKTVDNIIHELISSN